MKAAIYGTVALCVAGTLWYMYSESQKKPVTVPSFESDDQYLYNFLRADLMAFLPKRGTKYEGWNDDEVQANYDADSSSKSAAFIAMAIKHYPEKSDFYYKLLSNLNNRYQQ